MKVPVHNIAGEVVDEIEISEAVFGLPCNEAVVHQALLRQLANARQGSVDTKTRGEVSGGGVKIRRQKGSGQARQGSSRAPHRRGGGVVFGPHPRSFAQDMPKKMRRLAIRCCLSDKAAQETLVVVDELKLEEPRTREMANILGTLGATASALVVTAGVDANVVRSARNLPQVRTLPAAYLNVVDLISHNHMVATVDAVRAIEKLWGRSEG
ncbi:MAG: 50S ribosomal protein L4 [Chloroflexi bacterium]|nr:50S ribosomal protein L4 [Chloroflexota bacterium]